MKDPFDRTKVVLRHLPPALTQSALMEQIDGRFAARYNWVKFRPGKTRIVHLHHYRNFEDQLKLNLLQTDPSYHKVLPPKREDEEKIRSVREAATSSFKSMLQYK